MLNRPTFGGHISEARAVCFDGGRLRLKHIADAQFELERAGKTIEFPVEERSEAEIQPRADTEALEKVGAYAHAQQQHSPVEGVGTLVGVVVHTVCLAAAVVGVSRLGESELERRTGKADEGDRVVDVLAVCHVKRDGKGNVRVGAGRIHAVNPFFPGEEEVYIGAGEEGKTIHEGKGDLILGAGKKAVLGKRSVNFGFFQPAAVQTIGITAFDHKLCVCLQPEKKRDCNENDFFHHKVYVCHLRFCQHKNKYFFRIEPERAKNPH